MPENRKRIAMNKPMAAERIAPVPSPFGIDDANGEVLHRLADAREREGGKREGGDVALAIFKMLHDGAAEISFSLPAFPAANEADVTYARARGGDQWGGQAADPSESGGRMPTDGPEILFAAVAELRRCERTGTLIVKLVRSPPEEEAALAEQSAGGLQKWRLKRATDFIEANLENAISLNDLAAAAGLSPSYFGAQFRAATGLRPYEYVLHQRIRRAQEMLRDPTMTIIETALSVGFQTQAHFTTTFKRLVGATPCRWRHENRVEP